MAGPLSNGETESPQIDRLVAIDALRGFALSIFCVQEPLIPALRTLPQSSIRDLLIRHLTHAEWHGCTFYDLGFPIFIIAIAMSITYSYRNRRARGQSVGELFRRLLIRSILLFLFGTIFHGGFSVPLSDVRFTRVFHRLALAIFFSGLIELTTNRRGKVALLAALLLGYWALMELIPVPGFGTGDYTPAGNLNEYVDKVLLGARTYFVLSTLGVIGTCILGLLLGCFLQSDQCVREKAAYIAGAGVLLINFGFIWDFICPINKHIWTPSYVLFSAGWVFLIFLVFYLLIEVFKFRRWAFPLIVLGMNPLFTYAAYGLLPFDRYARLLLGEAFAPFFGVAHLFVLTFTQVTLLWLVVYWLHRKNLIIKV